MKSANRESEIDRLVDIYLSDADPDRAMHFVQIEIEKWNMAYPDNQIDMYEVQSKACQQGDKKWLRIK